MSAQLSRKHVLVLPNNVDLSSRDAPRHRFLRLPHPRTQLPSLFLPVIASSPDNGKVDDSLLEVQRIRPDTDKQKSWFVDQDVLSDGTLGLLTPFDPLWLIISILASVPQRFMQYAELWEWAAQHVTSGSNSDDTLRNEREQEFIAQDIVTFGQLDCVKRRLEQVCDTQTHESTTLYRISQPKTLDVLKNKVASLVDPVTGIFGPWAATNLNKQESQETTVDASLEPQPVQDCISTAASRVLGKDGIGDGIGLSESLQMESRTKTAVGVIANYLSCDRAQALVNAYSFEAMDKYLATITTSSVLSSTYLPGRGGKEAGGDSLGGGAAAQKRKATVTKGSRGVEALKKVSTKSMSKLSTYFTKEPAQKVKNATDAQTAAATIRVTRSRSATVSPRKRKAE
ncbi:hypothetical protein OIO90_000266 [Microbotryomycetes sp. JL221]|nr:hypothetical protein OIO90_000266 [Microbotryomycetes sp. JL221]